MKLSPSLVAAFDPTFGSRLMAAALVAALAACAPATPPATPLATPLAPPAPPPTTALVPAPKAAPPAQNPAVQSAVVITRAQVERAVGLLDGIVQELMQRSGVPGVSVAVVYEDQVLYQKGFGVRRAGAAEKVDASTVFQLASLSKPVGAAVIACAIRSGGVAWGDPVVKHLPWFSLSDPYVTAHVTIGDMYTHISGLPDHAGDQLEDLGFDRTEVLRRLRLEPLDPFRVAHVYTNFGLTAAGEAVARAKGTTWEELSETLLYRPLGMTSTSSRFADYEARTNKAALHVRVGDAWEAKYTRQPDAESPAGGVSSSASDMARWLRLELAGGTFDGKPLASPEALLAARQPHSVSRPAALREARSSFYGYGMGVGYDQTGRVRNSHSGAFSLGASTTVALLPAERLGIVVLTNAAPVGVPESVTETFLDEVELGYATRDWLAAAGPVFARFSENHSKLAGKTPPPDKAAAKPASAYAGTYQNAYYGPAEVVVKGSELVMRLGPKAMELPLTHWAGDTFSYMPPGENGNAITAVDFATGRGGRVTAMTVENLNATKLGVFRRQ